MQDVLVVGAGVVHDELVLVAVGEELPELGLPRLVARVHARIVPRLLLLLGLGGGSFRLMTYQSPSHVLQD